MVDQISIEISNNPTISSAEYSGINTAVNILEVANINVSEYPSGISDITRLEDSYIDIQEYDRTFLEAADILPFRIGFENIWIEAYGPGHPAAIGIAIIGYSNYIL
jgi:hypothetical protein